MQVHHYAIELQETRAQLAHIDRKTLIGYTDLPHYVTTAISNTLAVDNSMKFTHTLLAIVSTEAARVRTGAEKVGNKSYFIFLFNILVAKKKLLIF